MILIIGMTALMAVNALASQKPPVVAPETNEAVMFDDMLVNTGDIEPFDYNDLDLGAVKLDVKLWQDGVLPVKFSKGTSQAQKDRFFAACQVWSNAANVRCIEGAYKGRHVTITRAKMGCWALWGMGFHFVALRRRMNLQEDGCWSKSVIIHEIGHAFGLVHEHQRPDRDDFIQVNKDNANGGFLGLNKIVNFGPQGSRPLTPYDFLSIMHYARTAFSKNSKDTIVPRPQYMQYLNVMGRGSTISASDAITLSSLYGPPTRR